MRERKLKVAVYKFTSCDGCQLAFLNMGATLISLAEHIEFIHFAELGKVNPYQAVDIAFIEGSISTPEQLEQIQTIREKTKFLITIGACATAGGIQALKNIANVKQWVSTIYAHPEHIKTLDTSTAINEQVKVDFEIHGCPVSSEQVLAAINSLLQQVKPYARKDSVCMECKRLGNVCVLVTQNKPCMGVVTKTGCGALCPSLGRDCYACYGPKENNNNQSIINHFKAMGLSDDEIKRRFRFITNNEPGFKDV